MASSPYSSGVVRVYNACGRLISCSAAALAEGSGMRWTVRLAFAVLSSLPSVEAESQQCAVLPPQVGSTGYGPRPNSPRCEGMFEARIAGSGIELVSLTAGRVSWEESDSVLIIKPAGWTPSAKTHLRAVGLPAGLYYQLDAAFPSGADFRLPLDSVLRPERIGPSDVGAYAFRAVPGEPPEYLPVSVGSDKSRRTGDIHVVLRPNDPVMGVRFRLASTSRADAEAFRPVEGVTGFVPAGARIAIPLGSALPNGGIALDVAYEELSSANTRVQRFLLAAR